MQILLCFLLAVTLPMTLIANHWEQSALGVDLVRLFLILGLGVFN